MFGKDYRETSGESHFVSAVCRGSSEYFQIVSRMNNKVVEVDRQTLNPKMNQAHGGDNQLWRWEGQTLVSKYQRRRLEVTDPRARGYAERYRWRTDGDFLVSMLAENKVLDIEALDTSNSAKLIVYNKNGGLNQRWTLKFV